MKKREFMALSGSAMLSGLAPSLAFSQTKFPERPIRVIVPFAPGGDGDIIGRLWVKFAIAHTGANFIVDNKAGAGGAIGAAEAARAKADGYTLLLGQTGEITVNRLLVKDMGYDPMKELVPVVLIGNAPLIMLAPVDAPYNTVAEFIQQAKAKPDQFSYGSVGAGTPGHLSAVALGLGAKINMVHIPYKGVGPLLTDLMAGRLQAFFSSASAAMPHIKGGKLKALAVTTPKRMNSLPQVPTVAESGLPGFSYTLWGGLFAPAGTPESVIDSLNKEVNQILAMPDIKTRLDADNVSVPKNTPAEFAEYVKAEAAKFEKLVKEANIKAD